MSLVWEAFNVFIVCKTSDSVTVPRLKIGSDLFIGQIQVQIVRWEALGNSGYRFNKKIIKGICNFVCAICNLSIYLFLEVVSFLCPVVKVFSVDSILF